MKNLDFEIVCDLGPLVKVGLSHLAKVSAQHPLDNIVGAVTLNSREQLFVQFKDVSVVKNTFIGEIQSAHKKTRLHKGNQAIRQIGNSLPMYIETPDLA